MQINREDYIIERDYRKKRLEEFQEAIQENLRGLSTEIIAELVDERERQNLTQKELAERTGINQADISKLENGTRNPSVNLLKRLADEIIRNEIQSLA